MKEANKKPLFEGPAVITDEIISGFTIETIKQDNLKQTDSKLPECVGTPLKLKHDYKKWLVGK